MSVTRIFSCILQHRTPPWHFLFSAMGCASLALPLEECYGLTIAQADVFSGSLTLHFADAGGILVLKPYLSGAITRIYSGPPGPDGNYELEPPGVPKLAIIFGEGAISLTDQPDRSAFPLLREMLQGRSVTKIEKPKSTFAPQKSSLFYISFSATAPGTPVQNPEIRWGLRPDGVGVHSDQPMTLAFAFRTNMSSGMERTTDDYEVKFKPVTQPAV